MYMFTFVCLKTNKQSINNRLELVSLNLASLSLVVVALVIVVNSDEPHNSQYLQHIATTFVYDIAVLFPF